MSGFRKPCVVCGRRAVPDGNRCTAHVTPPPSSCRVCPRRALAGEGFCSAHMPTEADRLARAPYRHSYTKAQYRRNRARRYTIARGLCEACGVTLSLGWECDHVIALADHGTNALENLRALCAHCHTQKTKHDMKRRKLV